MSSQSYIVPQFVNYGPNKTIPYAFLSNPPPQKKRPSLPLPAIPVAVVHPIPPAPPRRRRSSTFSHIASWAAHVQPGSPGTPSPRSPRRRPSVSSSRRPSITRVGRRPSITHTRASSGSFLHLIDTPSVKNFDLTTLGYNAVFVHLPKTPSTPSPLLRKAAAAAASKKSDPNDNPFAHIPIPPIPASPPVAAPKRLIKHIRSLGRLRLRSKSTSATLPPSSPTKSSKPPKTPAVAKSKKEKYAANAPPLANELAIMQFLDGGSIESHAKRVMQKQAKMAAGTHYVAGAPGVGDVYRDGKGGIWYDADEELEYAHLLGNEGEEEDQQEIRWVQFDEDGQEKEDDAAQAIVSLARRESVSTAQDSDLDPKYLVEEQQPDDHVLSSRRIGMSALPTLAAKHLHKPEYVVDMDAFGPRSPVRSISSKSPLPRGKARRRPAPLKLTPLGRAGSPVDAGKVRKDFIEDSFSPSPLAPQLNLAASQSRSALGSKASKRNIRGLFNKKA